MHLLSFGTPPRSLKSVTVVWLVYNMNVCCRTQVKCLDQFDEPDQRTQPYCRSPGSVYASLGAHRMVPLDILNVLVGLVGIVVICVTNIYFQPFETVLLFDIIIIFMSFYEK